MKLEKLTVNKNSQISQKKNLGKYNALLENSLIHIIFKELHYCSSAEITKVEQIEVSILCPLKFMLNFVAKEHSPKMQATLRRFFCHPS